MIALAGHGIAFLLVVLSLKVFGLYVTWRIVVFCWRALRLVPPQPHVQPRRRARAARIIP